MSDLTDRLMSAVAAEGVPQNARRLCLEAAQELDRLTADQQRKIGALARYRIEMQLVDQLLEEGPNTETTSLDMEYWNDQHDQLKSVLQERDALREAMKALIRGYVNALENGRDRIIFLGGQCDPLDKMEASDIYLRAARAALKGAET